MAFTLPSPAHCCDPCEDQATTQIPGPAGEPGADGTNGTNGLNAYTSLTAPFTQPAVGGDDDAEVISSGWAVIGEDAVLEGGGYYLVTAIPDATHVTLQNRGYTANSAPGTVIPIASRLAPSGEKGAAGAGAGGGDMIGASNLGGVGGVASPDASLTNLGGSVTGVNIFKVASPSAIRFLRVNANNTVSLLSDSDQRTALGLAVGTNVQAFDADLTAIAALASAADQVPYATGAGTWALFTATTEGRNFLAQATVALMRSVLEVLPRYGLLASKIGVDFNIAANDNSVQVASSRYRIDRITVDNASVSLTTATLGVFTEPAAGGTTIMADQGLAALNATTKFTDPGLAGIVATDVLTDTVLYLRVGTAQGSDATGNVFIFGWSLE